MAKKPVEEPEKDRSDRWLLTYADLITLLLIFFIVLYSMSSISTKKFEAIAQSLSIVFGGSGKSGILDAGRSIIPGDKIYKQHLEMQNTEERIKRMIAQLGLEGKITTSHQDRGLVISVKDTVLFNRGEADLTPQAKEIVGKVTQILTDVPNAIRIEGHTDNDPIHNSKYPSNWELSTARATNVLQYFIRTANLPPSRLAAAGYGEYKPIAPNDSERSKALNRRVDIVVLAEEFSKLEPPGIKEQSPQTNAVSTPIFADDRDSALKTGSGTDLLPEDK
jgi:chemotaxis protein MotB